MKHFRSLFAAILAAALLLTALSSCSSFSSKKIVEYKDQSATEAVFRYLCCLEKTQFLYEAYKTDSSKTSASSLQDNAALWTMKDENGVTVGDTLKEQVLNRLKILLYLAQAASDAGYSLSASDKTKIKGELDSLASNFDTKKEFNKVLAEYGVNYDLLYEYYLLQGLASIGKYMLFGDGGKFAPTDARVQSYYDSHYFTFNFIYINNCNKTYPNGKTVVLTEEEKAAKNALIEELADKVAVLNGEKPAPTVEPVTSEPATSEPSTSEPTEPATREPEEITFESVCRAYSERFTEDTIANGMTYRMGTFPIAALEKAVLEAEEGKFVRVDVEKDGVYFVTRLPLDQTKLSTERSSVETELEEIDEQGLTDSAAADFDVDEDVFASVVVADLKHAQ